MSFIGSGVDSDAMGTGIKYKSSDVDQVWPRYVSSVPQVRHCIEINR